MLRFTSALARKGRELSAALRRAPAVVAVLARRIYRLSTTVQFLSAARCPIKKSSAGHVRPLEADGCSFTAAPLPAGARIQSRSAAAQVAANSKSERCAAGPKSKAPRKG